MPRKNQKLHPEEQKPRKSRGKHHPSPAPLRPPIGSAPMYSAFEFGLVGTPNAPLSGVLAIRWMRKLPD